MLVDPKSVKKIDNLTVFFTLLRSASVKAVRRMLMKLSPGQVGCSIVGEIEAWEHFRA